MLRCLGDYPLRLVTKEVITVENFKRYRAYWYVVCKDEHVKVDLLKVNLSGAGWITKCISYFFHAFLSTKLLYVSFIMHQGHLDDIQKFMSCFLNTFHDFLLTIHL